LLQKPDHETASKKRCLRPNDRIAIQIDNRQYRIGNGFEQFVDIVPVVNGDSLPVPGLIFYSLARCLLFLVGQSGGFYI